jgi:hypothetical protein
VTASGNWSNSAATKFDENTVILRGDARAALAYQAEFDAMWTHSRPFVWNETLPSVPSLPVTADDVAAAAGSDVWFTSANFRVYESSTYGWTWAIETSGVANPDTGWSGERSDPISPEAANAAAKLIDHMPSDIPDPSVGAIPEGLVTFEWYRSPKRVVLVVPTANNSVDYSIRRGNELLHGSAPFFGKLPETVLSQIRALAR